MQRTLARKLLFGGAFHLGIDASRRLVRGGTERNDFRVLEAKSERLPNGDQRLDQVGDLRLAVRRSRRDAKALGSFGDGRIVDRLDVDCVPLQQELACRLAL